MKFIDEIELKDKRVFIRVDFNCPLDSQGKVRDDTRIRAAMPTIEYALTHGAKVILGSHLGRPKGVHVPELSLMPVAQRLAELSHCEVLLVEDVLGNSVKKLSLEMSSNQIILLENLRFFPEESKNEDAFASKLAAMADVYIDDAFGVMHRAHASTYGMVKKVREYGAGFLVKRELAYLRSMTDSPVRPFIAILGGAKTSDKILVLENLLNLVDTLVIGGAMAYTFLKSQGYQIGKSLVDDHMLKTADHILQKAKARGIKILLPLDHIVVKSLEAPNDFQMTTDRNIENDCVGVDIGPKTIEVFNAEIAQAKMIVWNGPVGIFEKVPFNQGTLKIAEAVAMSGATSVIGGGDSIAAVKQSGLADKITHMSTGGGATLTYLEGKGLVGIKILE